MQARWAKLQKDTAAKLEMQEAKMCWRDLKVEGPDFVCPEKYLLTRVMIAIVSHVSKQTTNHQTRPTADAQLKRCQSQLKRASNG